jgi:hypothetical protein
MTDQNLTEIICIIDRSGSMESIRDDAIGGFNAFLEEQKKQPGKALLTYCQFDTEYDIIHNGKPIQEVPPLDHATYVPRGSTALLDAIGRTVNEVGARLDKTPEHERPGKVIVVVLTDGQENASREFNRQQIKDMIDRQSGQFNWQFVYLSADANGFTDAMNIGIHADAFVAFQNTGDSTRKAYSTVSSAVSGYRSSGSIGNINQN